MRKRKNNFYYFVFIILFTLGVGFALITSKVSVNGNTKVNKIVWDVHLGNVQVKEGSIKASTPEISEDGTSVDFYITFNVPGEYYEFTVDVLNYGTLDAMIDTIKKTNLSSAQQRYLDYIVEYENGEQIENKQIIPKYRFSRIRVRVELKRDIQKEDLPTETQSLDLGFELRFLQEDGTGVFVLNNGVDISEGVSTINSGGNTWEEIPGFTLYDAVNLKRREMEDAGVGSYYGATSDYEIKKATLTEMFFDEELKVLNMKNTIIEPNKTYNSFDMVFGESVNINNVKNDNYVTLFVDAKGIIMENTHYVCSILNPTQTYKDAVYTLFPNLFNFVDPTKVKNYYNAEVGENIIGFAAGESEGCASGEVHRFYAFYDEDNNLKKMNDTISSSERLGLWYFTVDLEEMSWADAQTYAQETLNSTINTVVATREE